MLDLRLPIGLLFVIIGTMLVVWGFIEPVETQLGAGTVNLNITWGAVMGLFGLVMALLALRERFAPRP